MSRSGRTVVTVGAGAALLWYLLRPGQASGQARERVRRKLGRCRVYVDNDGILTLNDEASDLLRAAQLCERVVLDAAGSAPFGVVEDVREALERAGLMVEEGAP